MKIDRSDFTGSRSYLEKHELFRLALPVKIAIRKVEDYTDGRRTGTWFDWEVYLRGESIARFDLAALSRVERARNRPEAIREAKRAANIYASSVGFNL